MQRVVTAAAGMLKENKDNASKAARMIMDALLWEGINKLSRSDRDIILAKEHLISCLFASGDFSRAEDFSREVVAARKATKPTDPLLIRDAQQKLVHTLLEIAMQHKEGNNLEDATRVNNEALDLALRNMDIQENTKVSDDALDVLHFCDELLEYESSLPTERTRLLEIKIRALQKAGSDQSVDDLRELTLERLRLTGLYVLELKDKRRGNEVYSNVQSSIEAFRTAVPYEKDAACNFGNTRANVSLPARMDGVFKIFACDHKGNASTMNPQPLSSNRDYGFSILGCEIESTWPMKLREESEKTGLKIVEKPKPGGLWTTMSGTSFATPIAAALVAITYQFHDENTVRMDFQPGVEMKRPETVKAVLLRMSLLPGINGYNTLMPTVGRQNHFKFQPGRGKPMLSFFADKLSDITWDDL
ncbi:hypothetical protein CkaCkLH20_03397 [Colletotrichum karsti]|uniref:Peptidase S8/S53 domain-containing protein n=1 Tax=Colletotrichum karsti TaxID=1095194 RepID=A0A9P6LKA2_9PEZI|nr:uncharacterized protein CkaCkLH20_03397 [Colletotrichum karsti]KAF9879164.1 hypothetical protein CkaCkLH20_03397 [Colletotrichum karsti]